MEQTSEPLDKYAVFERWLFDNGCQFPKLYLKDYGDEMRGCHTKADIEADETIIEIPLQCLITVEMGKETKTGRLILSSDLNLDAPKHVFIMLFMLMDRKCPTSFFKPYYDILPPTLHNMPIFWNEEELGYLKGSYMLDQIEERNAAIARDYQDICQLDPEFVELCSLDDFKWARMCVCSRNFGLLINNVRTAALVPYADMLNHYRPRETKWQFEDSSQSFTIVALNGGIMAGAQVYDSYGQKCNHRFLLNYGFSVESNLEPDGFCPNEVPLFLSLDEDDPLYEAKLPYWMREVGSPCKMIRVLSGDNENTRSCMSTIRTIVADGEDFDLLLLNRDSRLQSASSRSGSITGHRSMRNAQTAVSVRNEIATLQFLRDLCDRLLAGYTSSLAEDCTRLSTPDLVPMFSNERHALIQVKGEKEVLMYYRELSEACLSLLEIRLDAKSVFESKLTEISQTKSFSIHQYCLNVIQRLRNEEIRLWERRQRSVNLALPTVV